MLIRSLRAVVPGTVFRIGISPVAARFVRSNDGAGDRAWAVPRTAILYEEGPALGRAWGNVPSDYRCTGICRVAYALVGEVKVPA